MDVGHHHVDERIGIKQHGRGGFAQTQCKHRRRRRQQARPGERPDDIRGRLHAVRPIGVGKVAQLAQPAPPCRPRRCQRQKGQQRRRRPRGHNRRVIHGRVNRILNRTQKLHPLCQFGIEREVQKVQQSQRDKLPAEEE